MLKFSLAFCKTEYLFFHPLFFFSTLETVTSFIALACMALEMLPELNKYISVAIAFNFHNLKK